MNLLDPTTLPSVQEQQRRILEKTALGAPLDETLVDICRLVAEGTPAQTWEMRVWTFIYFAFFVLLFFLSKGGKTKPVPDRVTH